MKHRHVIRHFIPAVLALVCAVAPVAVRPAHAELSNDTIAGPGLRLRPAYDGSNDSRVEVVPVIRYLGEPLFIRSTQGVLEGGLRLQLAPGLHGGAQLAYEPGRDPTESDFLKYRGVPGVNRGASYGLHLEWDHQFGPMPVTVLARVRKHTDNDRGTQGDLRVSGGLLKYQAFSLGAFVQTTWASAKATDSMYGVSLPVAVASGLPTYSAGSGFLYGSAGLLWSLDLAPAWALVGNLEARRLSGDARDSPLAQRTSSYYAAAGIVYRFK